MHFYPKLLANFQTLFNLINVSFFDGTLQDVTLTLKPTKNALGHFTTTPVWYNKITGSSQHEINISAKMLSKSIDDIVCVIIHEAIHMYCYQNDIADVSANGYYHNVLFKTEARKRLLTVEHHNKYGFSITKPSDELREWIKKNQIYEILYYYHNESDYLRPPKSSTRKYMCPTCGDSVRATKEVSLICGNCHSNYELVEKKYRT